jgi:hypothetical protein
MEIINAQLLSFDKRTRISGGVYIDYISSENVIKGSIVELDFENKKHYFEVTNITINGKDLEVKAKEIGFWVIKFDNTLDFNLKKLVGLSVSRVEDKENISKIREMSGWC